MIIFPNKKRLHELTAELVKDDATPHTNATPQPRDVAGHKTLWLSKSEAAALATRGELEEPDVPQPRPQVYANSKTIRISVFHRTRRTNPVNGKAGRWLSRKFYFDADPKIARRLLLAVEHGHFVAGERAFSHLCRISESTHHSSHAEQTSVTYGVYLQ